MSRYIRSFQLDQPIDVVSIVVEDFVYHNRLRRADWNGEMVYSGALSTGTDIYFKWAYAGGVFRMEAWIRGLGGKEAGLEGGLKKADKREYKEKLDNLELELRNHCGHVSSGAIGFDPTNHEYDEHEDMDEDAPYENSVGYDYSYEEAGKQKPDMPNKELVTWIAIFLVLSFMGGPGIVGGILFYYMYKKKKGEVSQNSIAKVLKVYFIFIFIGILFMILSHLINLWPVLEMLRHLE